MQCSATNGKVIGHEHTDHGSQEDGPALKDREESGCGVDKIPRDDGHANCDDDECTPSDIDILRGQRRQIHARGYGVEHDTQGQLARQQAQAGEKSPGARGGVRGGLGLDKEQQQERVPEDLPVQSARGGGDENAEESGQTDCQRRRSALTQ